MIVKNIRLQAVLLLFTLFLHGCGKNYTKDASWAMETFGGLSLRQKVAQMLIYRMNMRFLSSSSKKWKEIQSLLETDGIGGVHIWYGDVGTSLTLLNKMQKYSDIPILVDADIEHGLYQRFPEGTELPPFMALAATDDPDLAYAAGKIVATEGRSVGIHWNFAPVVDVNNNPRNPIINTRSFGEDPDQVSIYGKAYIRGLQDHGMLATAKHFPGHGDTEKDSHSSMAQIPSDALRLWSVEINPFINAISSDVDAVMVSHVHAPDYQFNADLPATLSKFWVSNILKDSLGFKGVVVTDAMSMGGITNNYSDSYGLIAAVNAGCDFIIQNGDFKGSIDVIEQAVLDSIIPEERIDESVLKILRMKEKIGLNGNRFIEMKDAQGSLKDSSFQITANRMAAKALTLVKNETKFFPLELKKREKLYIIDIYDHKNDHSESITTKALRELGANVHSFQLDESDKKYVSSSILKEIPKESTVIVNAFVSPSSYKNRITLSKNQEKFIQSLAKKSEKILLNSYGTPYLIENFPMVNNYICSWKGNRIMQNAFVRALTGRENISGKLPITIPGVAERNFGIPIRKKPIWFTQEPAHESGKKLKWVMPAEAGADVTALDLLLDEAIADSAWPGNVLLAAKDGQVFYHEANGYHTYSHQRRMSPSDIFDLASISKAVSTTSAVMFLVEQNKVSLDTKIHKIIPQFSQKKDDSSSAREKITLRHLLTHTAGFPAFKQYYLMDIEAADILADICNTELVYEPETKTIYSDLGLILLGAVIESVAGMPLDTFVAKHLFEPMGMSTTYYNPPQGKKRRIVPTEIVSVYRNGLIHGEVHDENAHKLGGVAGHAGLFSTARDLAKFAQCMLQGGIYGNKRIFKEKTVQQFTSRTMVDSSSSRCLGWDSPSGEASGGIYLSDHSFGHTGYTGTSLWIDPTYDLFVILLTNAVHPHRDRKSPKYFDWRQRIHSAVYESLGITEKNPKLIQKERWQQPVEDTLMVQ